MVTDSEDYYTANNERLKNKYIEVPFLYPNDRVSRQGQRRRLKRPLFVPILCLLSDVVPSRTRPLELYVAEGARWAKAVRDVRCVGSRIKQIRRRTVN